MIKIQNLNKIFQIYDSPTPKKVLKNINLTINDGECVVIAGENGSGKTVLMSILSGLESDFEGIVECVDYNGNKQRVGLVFQEAETQILGETPREDISFGPKNLKWKKDKIEITVKNALEKTGLTEKAEFPSRFLSGGEKRRLAIASVIAMESSIIILDEPYANLDYMSVKQVNSLIKELKSDGKTVIILTHETEKCLGMADRLIILYKGEKVFDGTADDGLKQDLEKWNIKNPLTKYDDVSDLIW